MAKYSKDKLKMKRGFKITLTIFILLLVICGAFLLFVGLKNNIVKEKISNTAKEVSDDIATNSSPIVINNVLVGGIYEKKWVSSERYFLKSTKRENTELDVYNKKGKAGTFSIKEIKQDAKSVYVLTNNLNVNDEYIAVSKNSTNLMPVLAVASDLKDDDYKYVKNALGVYRLFNTSIKVNKAYDVTIGNNEIGRIIVASNVPGKSAGAYSTVIYVDQNDKAKIIKYNYVRDLDNASDWAVYSLMFVIDLNNDGINEIVLQETKEFDVEYSILEYKNNNFVEVLSSQFKAK